MARRERRPRGGTLSSLMGCPTAITRRRTKSTSADTDVYKLPTIDELRCFSSSMVPAAQSPDDSPCSNLSSLIGSDAFTDLDESGEGAVANPSADEFCLRQEPVALEAYQATDADYAADNAWYRGQFTPTHTPEPEVLAVLVSGERPQYPVSRLNEFSSTLYHVPAPQYAQPPEQQSGSEQSSSISQDPELRSNYTSPPSPVTPPPGQPPRRMLLHPTVYEGSPLLGPRYRHMSPWSPAGSQSSPLSGIVPLNRSGGASASPRYRQMSPWSPAGSQSSPLSGIWPLNASGGASASPHQPAIQFRSPPPNQQGSPFGTPPNQRIIIRSPEARLRPASPSGSEWSSPGTEVPPLIFHGPNRSSCLPPIPMVSPSTSPDSPQLAIQASPAASYDSPQLSIEASPAASYDSHSPAPTVSTDTDDYSQMSSYYYSPSSYDGSLLENEIPHMMWIPPVDASTPCSDLDSVGNSMPYTPPSSSDSSNDTCGSM